ncbi:HlyD family secretion protein [Dokdonella sp.]|uniref:HlyD family secretion protein n=1 Tax=Dokdonella sp. TaxID=2291710 RepID=UPI003C4580E4
MILAIALIVIYSTVAWLVFFKYKLLRWSIPWAIFSSFFLLHALLIFMIGLRFVTPFSRHATVVQHTIQLTPRLTEPTLVTAVLVKPDEPVKKGQPLFQFDKRPYEYNVRSLEAQLAEADQGVLILKADVDVATENLSKARADLEYAKFQQNLFIGLAKQGAGTEEDAQKWSAQLKIAQASVREAKSQLERAELKYHSDIDGVNTTVAAIESQLKLARYYLDNTTMVAPEDGRIINLQVRPGMVAGEVRFGAIATFICDDDRYLIAQYFMENLKYVKPGQPVEVALDLYPGQIFKAHVDAIWKGSGQGQFTPSGTLPHFLPKPPEAPQGQFVVKIMLDDPDQSLFPIGAQGAAAIYTPGMTGPWAALRRIGIRTHSWLNWLYPMPF